MKLSNTLAKSEIVFYEMTPNACSSAPPQNGIIQPCRGTRGQAGFSVRQLLCPSITSSPREGHLRRHCGMFSSLEGLSHPPRGHAVTHVIMTSVKIYPIFIFAPMAGYRLTAHFWHVSNTSLVKDNTSRRRVSRCHDTPTRRLFTISPHARSNHTASI